jgi:adenylate cyclase
VFIRIHSWFLRVVQNWKGGGIGALATFVIGLVLLLLDPRSEDKLARFVRHFPLSTHTENLVHFVHRLPFSGPSENLVHLSYDLPFHYRAPIPAEEAVLVYMDDASHTDLGQPYDNSWDRGLYGRLLERLTAEGARAVAFDIVFSDPNPTHPEGDERLAQAMKANGKVVLAADFQPTADGMGMSLHRALETFTDTGAASGMAQLAQDQDVMVRRHLHTPAEAGNENISSLSWELARVAGARVAQDPRQRYGERWINYYGPRDHLPNVSFVMALETNGYCPAGVFSGKVVVVGANVKSFYSGVRKDELRTPYTKGNDFVPAVDVQATLALNLLRGDWLKRTSLKSEVLMVLFIGLLLGYGLSLYRPLPAVALAIGAGFLVALLAQWTFTSHRLWFPWMIIAAAQIPVALLWSVVFNSVQLYVQNRLYEHSLKMFLPPKLVKKFSSNRELLKPGAAEKQILTLLFSDIADFTSVSEGLDSDDLAALMNAYFQAAVGDCIHKTDGTVGKFLGDGVFAFWNAPDHQADHAFRACEAALRFRKLNERPIHGRSLRTRVGLHTGMVKVGNFGSEDRVDYTALGENVNLASRLEGLNKFLGTDCLISRETKAELGDRLLTRPVGSFRLKGFEGLVEAHELMGWPDQEQASRAWREAFAEALSNFELRHLELAEMGFRQVLNLHPNDGPTRFYLKQIQERASEVTPENLPDTWASYTILKEK